MVSKETSLEQEQNFAENFTEDNCVHIFYAVSFD